MTALCAVPQPLECEPCTRNTECGATGADECLSIGGGAFCGLDCTFATCTAGYACAAIGIMVVSLGYALLPGLRVRDTGDEPPRTGNRPGAG